MASSRESVPSLEEIRRRTTDELRRDPCRWQARTTQDILRGDKDVIAIAPTGAGKTLTFWMPLLFRPNGIQLVVTPLNLLGTQNECDLGVLGMRAVAVRAETATPQVFRVSEISWSDISILND